MKKDHVFTYKGKKGAAFDNYEIKPFGFGSTKTALKEYKDVGSVEQCFKKCVTTTKCQTFTYFSGVCTLWENYAIAADGTKDKSIVEFCPSLGSTAGYIGYNPKESAEDKGEKSNCKGDKAAWLKTCESFATCSTNWSATCSPSGGVSCTCAGNAG